MATVRVSGSSGASLLETALTRPDGGVADAGETFVDGCQIAQRWAGQTGFCVLETGFGLGINFLATLLCWLADPHRCDRLFYVAVEPDPVGIDLARQGLTRLAAPPQRPKLAELAEQLLQQWPAPLAGSHRLYFADRSVVLQLVLGDLRHVVPRLSVAADAIYLDRWSNSGDASPGNAPAPALIRAVARLARERAVLSARLWEPALQQTLTHAGFDVFQRQRPRGEGESLQAVRAGRQGQAQLRRPATRTRPSSREVLVIGAGLAGCAIAESLQTRGWQVEVIDQGPQALPDGWGSGQPWCSEHLHLSADDNPLARLTRAAWSLAGRADAATSASRRVIGKLMLASSDTARDHHLNMLARTGIPPDIVRWVDATEACELSGLTVSTGGLWWPGCAIVEPAARVSAQLRARSPPSRPSADAGGRSAAGSDAHPGAGIRTGYGQSVASLQRRDLRWHVLDVDGNSLASAPTVVLANGGQATQLAALDSVTLQFVVGQSSLVHDPRLTPLRCVLGGDAYALPMGDGRILTGASNRALDASLRPDARLPPWIASAALDQQNLQRLSAMLGGRPLPADSVVGHTAGLRFAARDHLPLIGAVPDEALVRSTPQAWQRNDRLPIPTRAGLYVACAFGGRGLLWSTLAAELIAALLDDEPAPIESDLQAAIDPARFLRHRLRRGDC